MNGLNVMENRDEAIKKFLKEYDELYVVDVILKDKFSKPETQWYIYEKIEDVNYFLDIVKNYYMEARNVLHMADIENKEGFRHLRFEYDEFFMNHVWQDFTVTRITRAA